MNTCIDANDSKLESPTRDLSSVTYFDHDHCESENVRFLAISLPIEDLWCSPSRGTATPSREVVHGVQVSKGGEAKTRDACMPGVVQKDISLARYQWGAKQDLEKPRTPSRCP